MATRYPIIKEYILDKIENGTFQEGMMLPPEKVFTEQFSVSRMTVRRAFDELIHDGKLVRKRGQSVYVAKRKIHRTINRVSISNDKELIEEFGPIRIEVIDVKVVKKHPVASSYFKLNSDEELWEVKRVQLGWEIPIVYEIIYFPRKYFEDMTKEECKQTMRALVPLKMKEEHIIKNKIEVNATIASSDIAEFLNIERKSPILHLDNICYNEEGTCIYFGRDFYDGNSFKYCEDTDSNL